MEFRILGPLKAVDEGGEIALGGSKQRALLAVLLLHANEIVSTDTLIEELWGEQPPATAAKTVQVHVSRLRKTLGARGDQLIVTRGPGYQLQVEPGSLDAGRFEQLVAEGRDELAAGRPQAAVTALEKGLALWRGAPLADLTYEPFAQREIARLADLRVAAIELQIEARIALGGHAEVIGELEALIAEHPYRERLHAQLMLALYRSDRQADALQAYQDARRTLVEELGIEPGERLRELESAVLAQDPSLAAPAQPAPDAPRQPDRAPPAPVEATRPARRLVSIVFADLVGSTGLAERIDPESMHDVLDRFTETCSSLIERHGGSVEGFIGDAVVGVFGLEELHEDDALRAVRVAVEMREAGAALSAALQRERGVTIEMKFGVESGEVFLGTGTRRPTFAAGDAFNVAARLEGMAQAGEILLGERVHPLVEESVRAEPLEPLALKGRAAKVQAWRLLELVEEPARWRPPTSPFVGRQQEIDQLRGALARAREQQACQAVTVIGPAGIGKSRLVRELAGQVGEQATVVIGRCQSYGEGVTYRPLAEIVRQIGGDDPRPRLTELVDEPIAELILGAIGLTDTAIQTEETFWAVRTLLERVAQERPLMVVVEDVHWAQPTLLDLLEYLVAFSSAHPLLLVAMARPELFEDRPQWAAPLPNRSLLLLDPLPEAEARRLVEEAGDVGSHTAAEIVELAEGNPLFLEQLVAVGSENGTAPLPSSIQAVLATRIDHLEPAERAVLELGSVQGRTFYVGPVAEVLTERDRAEIAAQLVSLVQKQLIRADRSEVPGDDAFRFAHALIREAAYQGLPRQRRAELHEGVANWLQELPGATDENIAYHLAQAYRQMAELGRAGDRERALATAAAERYDTAAGAAVLRGDAPAAATLLERAVSLLAADDPARAQRLLPRLGAALLDAGRLADAERVLREAVESAGEDTWLRSRARVELQLVRLQAGSTDEDSAGIVQPALDALEAQGDELGQCRALCLGALQSWLEGRVADADEAWERAAVHAEAAGDEATLVEILDWRAAAAMFGPTPVRDGIRRCQAIRDRVRSRPVAEARTCRPLAALHAMAGEIEEADRLIASADEILGEVGGLQSAVAQQEAIVDLLAGRPAAAEERLRESRRQLEEMGERALLADTASMLAQALYAQSRLDEAAELCDVAETAAAEGDLTAQIGWRAVRAKLLAAEGRLEEALKRAEEAVGLAERTDFLTIRAEALLDLAVVLRQAGRPGDADAASDAALELYRRKGVQRGTEEDRAQVHDGQAR